MVARDFPPYGADIQRIRPSLTIADWTDPNSLLQTLARSGNETWITLKSPASGRDTPSTGASILIPLRNFRGELSTTGDNMAMLQPVAHFSAIASLPAYTWLSMVPVVGTSPTTVSLGVGHSVDSDGTGLRGNVLVNTAGSWTIITGASGYTASGRYMTGKRFSGSDGSIATNTTTQVLDANGLAAQARVDSTNRNLGTAPITHSYLMVSAGWTSASGTTGSVIKVDMAMFAGLLSKVF